jgi:hypothetical protein
MPTGTLGSVEWRGDVRTGLLEISYRAWNFSCFCFRLRDRRGSAILSVITGLHAC